MTSKLITATSRIRKLIKSGIYSSGSKLPTERELAEEFGLSQGTIAKSLFILAGEGLVKKVHGSGNFVQPSNSTGKKSICFLIDAMGNELNPIWHSIYEYFYFYADDTFCKIDLLPIFDKNKLEQMDEISDCDLLVVGVGLKPEKRLFLNGFNRPVIWLDETDDTSSGATICNDNFAAGEMVGKHFVENGCRELLYITYAYSKLGVRSYPSEQRFDGFLKGARATGADIRSVSMFSCFPSQSSFKGKLEAYLSSVDGIFCFSDALAAEILRVLTSSNKSVPQDFALAGVDGLPLGELLSPSLTSVKQDCRSIGKAAWETARRILEGKKVEGIIKIKPELIIRDSSRREVELSI